MNTNQTPSQSQSNKLCNLKKNSIVEFGSYYTNSRTSKSPIKWIVLDVNNEEGHAFLLSLNVLDKMFYSDELAACSKKIIWFYPKTQWATSIVRTYLNYEFINEAFTEDEQAQIVTTKVRTLDMRTRTRRRSYGSSRRSGLYVNIQGADFESSLSNDFSRITYSSEQAPSDDKLFILSKNEVNTFLYDTNFKHAKPTFSLLKNGVQVDKEGFCRWTLRSTTDKFLDQVGFKTILSLKLVIKLLIGFLIAMLLAYVFRYQIIDVKSNLLGASFVFFIFIAFVIIFYEYNGKSMKVESNIRPAMFVKLTKE